jgi:hypothetical protein
MANDEKIVGKDGLEKDVAGKDVSTNSVAVSEQDAILAFLAERESVYNELIATKEELEAEKTRRNRLRADWKERKRRLNDQQRQKEAIMIMAGQVVDPEQENKNRYRYATQAFFTILGLCDKSTNGEVKALFSSFNPIQLVCKIAMACASCSDGHTIRINADEFIRRVKEEKAKQDEAKRIATQRIEDEWQKRSSANAGIQQVDAIIRQEQKVAGNLQKKKVIGEKSESAS